MVGNEATEQHLTERGLHVDHCKLEILHLNSSQKSSTIDCEEWDYDRTEYPETAVSQFNLICSQRFWIFLSQSIYLMGYVIGHFIFGIISDKFGRKPAIIISAVLSFVFSSLAVFSNTIVLFNLFRFFVGAFSTAAFFISFTYCLEIVEAKWKSFVSVIFSVAVSLGFVVVPFLSWVFPRWTHLQLVATVPILLVIIPICFPSFFAESPRWLLANEISSKCDEEMSIKQSTNKLDLFITPGIRNNTLVLLYIWCVFTIIYIFVIMNAKSIIPGNATINIVTMSALDLIAAFASFPFIQYAERRLSSCLCFVIVAACFLASYFVPSVMMRQTFVLIGQFVNNIVFSIMYVYSSEIYPTVIRSIGLGLLGGVSRIAAMLPPLLLPFMKEGEAILVLGIMAFVAALFVRFLPETKDVEMTDKIENREREGRLKMFKKEKKKSCK